MSQNIPAEAALAPEILEDMPDAPHGRPAADENVEQNDDGSAAVLSPGRPAGRGAGQDAGRRAGQQGRPVSVRIGFALFVLGLLCLIVTVLPFFFGDHNRPLWLNVGCMLAPIGFVVAVTGAIRSGRREQRAALADIGVRTR